METKGQVQLSFDFFEKKDGKDVSQEVTKQSPSTNVVNITPRLKLRENEQKAPLYKKIFESIAHFG
ncbi:hypothetical protein [Noviherbaspirillum sp.]|jgi:hypothetical protein|uniref:hypothetical protein n=1 Tax=Noviherbaspirillum sp. TaxID=1926288 RepID=UPI0025E1F092|nr:hypothetical protein [Noviherbaspirillum sp.]